MSNRPMSVEYFVAPPPHSFPYFFTRLLPKHKKTQNKIFSGEEIGGENLKLKIHNETNWFEPVQRNC